MQRFFSSIFLPLYIFIFLPLAKKCFLTDKKLHRLMKSLAQSQAHHILTSIINTLTGGSLLLFSVSVKCLILFFFIHFCSFPLT